MDAVIFKKSDDGELYAVKEENIEPIRDANGNLQTPMQYYQSIGYPVQKWDVESKAKFIDTYGSDEYRKLYAGSFDQDVTSWTSREKSRYVAAHGMEAYKKLFERSSAKGRS
jgi:hypothetical protein